MEVNTPGAAGAFLLVGPVVTAGLCELSRCRDHGEVSNLPISLQALRRNCTELVVFALSVVTVPMIIDRHVDAGTAMHMSLRVTLKDLPAMLVRVLLIVGLVAFSFATQLPGLVVVLPLLGHATWYAYRDIVEEA